MPHQVLPRGSKIPVEEAKKRYLAAWIDFKDETSEGVQDRLCGVMDSLQESICPGPCKEWEEYIDTLPGYRDFWSNFRRTLKEKVDGCDR